MTPRVKELLILILPATLGGGIYYISQLFYAYFATQPARGLARLSRLRRPPEPAAAGDHRLGARHRDPADDQPRRRRRRRAPARRSVQGQATELAMLLTLPAAVALAVTAGPIVAALFQGGRFTAEDAATTGAGPVDHRRRPSRLCADQGADAGLLRPQGHEDAGLYRRRLPGRSASR